MTKVKQRRQRTSRPSAAKRATSAKGKASRVRKATRKRGTPARPPRIPEPPLRTVRLRELDPQAKCGRGTSVERLFRVDETIKGATTAHLVFFDRHGLYCEHGRNCPAVDDVRRAHRNLDWTRKVG